jgi:hypothetical protein
MLDQSALETVREIVGNKTFETIESLCGELNSAQESAMNDDVGKWEEIKDKHLRMVGGADGIDIDNERARRAIRKRVTERLGLATTTTGGLFHIPVSASYANGCDY